jgi:hypothetical protein
MYASEREIEAVVRGFEMCTTPAADFSHASHLTVTVWYLSRGSFATVLDQFRDGLFRFIDRHHIDKNKYNETITHFWIRAVADYLKEVGPEHSLLDQVNTVVERFSNSRLVFEYYSKELVNSDQAKREWVEPDLKRLSEPPAVAGG